MENFAFMGDGFPSGPILSQIGVRLSETNREAGCLSRQKWKPGRASLQKRKDMQPAVAKNRLRIVETWGKKIKPVLKWVGGKRQLLGVLQSHMPEQYNRYFEPFIGGGALFFEEGWKAKRSTIGDVNPDLIGVYQTVRNSPEELLTELEGMPYNEEFFYDLRGQDTSEWSDVRKAARIIYLNKTCYNGLYRVNRKGQFNVPFGRYKNPNIADAENIRAVHEVLQHTNILLGDFTEVTKGCRSGDFVYFDPPYMPLSSSSNFTQYSKGGFGIDQQARLAEHFHQLAGRGVQCMLSNSNHPDIRSMYKDFKIVEVAALRNVNSKADKRGPIKELLIVSY
jgi:DNA adenine methylase